VSTSVDAAVRRYLATTCNQYNKDLVDWFLSHPPKSIEWHANPRTDRGVAIVEEREGKKPFKFRRYDGIDFWPIRYPRDAKNNPDWDHDPNSSFPFEVCLQEVGTTGFAREGEIQWVYDIDSVFGHGKGLTDDQIAEIEKAVEPIDYVAVRRSTGGKGRHIYIRAAGIQLANHTEHAALGRAHLGQTCLDAGLNFAPGVDVCGGNTWFASRRATLENRGFELLKPATRILTPADLPANWRDHLEVVAKKRSRVRVLGADENQCAEWSQNVAADETHDRIFEDYKKTGYVLTYIPDWEMWHGHTGGLKKVFQNLGLKGYFDTDTKDTDPNIPNCYWFLRPDGVLFVVRFNCQKEHWSWGNTEKQEACCLYNVPIDLETACKVVGGIWGGDFCTCPTLEQAKRLAQLFNFELPPLQTDRAVNFRHTDPRTIIAETTQIKGETVTGWALAYRKLVVTFPTERRIVKHGQEYDSFARHLITTERRNGGWVYKTTEGAWVWDTKDTVFDRLGNKFGIPSKNRSFVMGGIASNPYTLVNEPLQPEFLPGRRMNQFGAQFAIEPTYDGNHPHYDLFLDHIGRGLDEAVKNNEWCQKNWITTGREFLLLWCAILAKDPRQHLPLLYLYSRERDNGKSVLHKALGLLFSRGYVSGTLAMNEKFNKLLAGAVLAYLDEERISAASAQKVKLYVDADKIELRLMQTDAFMFDNFCHWIACYNFTDGIFVEDGDERVIMVEVPTLYDEQKLDWKTKMLPALESEKADFLGTLLSTDLPPSGSRLYLPVLSTELKESVMAANRTNTPCDRKELLQRIVEKVKENFRGPSSVVSQADGSLSRVFRARRTFSKMSSAFATQTKPLGLAL